MLWKKALVVMMILSMFSLAACGGDGDGGGTPGSPDEVAQAVMDIYLEGLTTISGMADNPPSLEDAKAQLEPLKEDMITRLVELGKIRATMNESDQSAIDSALLSKFMGVDKEMFDKYNEVLAHYRSQHIGFANFLASINTITQYADFELLKEQEPEEAARLGIE